MLCKPASLHSDQTERLLLILVTDAPFFRLFRRDLSPERVRSATAAGGRKGERNEARNKEHRDALQASEATIFREGKER